MSRLFFALITLPLAAGVWAAEPEVAPETAREAGFEVVADGRTVVSPASEAEIRRPSMNYFGFSAHDYSSAPADNGSGPDWAGYGVALDFGREVSEFIVFTARFRRTEAELEHSSNTADITENHYELGLAFAAPFGEQTRLLLETGLAGEDFDLETRTSTTPAGSSLVVASSDDSQGVYGAIELRTMLGNSFEIDLRSAGHQMFDTRRLVHSAGFRIHFSRRIALGVHHERWERGLRETARTSLDLRIDY